MSDKPLSQRQDDLVTEILDALGFTPLEGAAMHDVEPWPATSHSCPFRLVVMSKGPFISSEDRAAVKTLIARYTEDLRAAG